MSLPSPLSQLNARPHADIVHLLPEDSFYNQAAKEQCLLHEGDLTLTAPLNLDALSTHSIAALIVTGNLHTGNIYNEETDGSCGRVILGDLHADNIVVGGQEIAVGGQLQVSGLYWGDYNHGSLLLGSGASIRVLIGTDSGYDRDQLAEGVDSGNIHIQHWLCSEGDMNDDQAMRLLSALAAGRPVLRTEKKTAVSLRQGTTTLFANTSLSPANLIAMLQPQYFNHVAITNGGFRQFSLHVDDARCFQLWQPANSPETGGLEIQRLDAPHEYALYIYLNSAGELELSISREFDVHHAQTLTPEDFPDEYAFMQQQWAFWLEHYSRIIQSRRCFERDLTRADFERFLYNRIIRAYYQKHRDKAGYVEVDGTLLAMTDSRITLIDLNDADDPDSGYDFWHLQWNDELGRIVVVRQDDFDNEEYEANFDLFNYYTNAANLFYSVWNALCYELDIEQE